MAVKPATQAGAQALSLNMKLISHHDMGGFGGMGEGMGMQKTKDGRRVIWLGHEAAPLGEAVRVVADPDAHSWASSRTGGPSGARRRSLPSKTQTSATPSEPRKSTASG